MKGVEYRGVTSIDGPIIIVRRTEKIFYGETVYVRDRNGEKRTGRVIDLSETAAVVQIFGTTTGLDLGETTYEFLDQPLELRVGEGLLGRIFNGLGEPIDGYPQIISNEKINVNGNPITANTWRANEMAILFYDANSYSGTTGVWSLIPGVTYIHPQYTARTGVPTANQTPSFGGTFSVNQITSDSTGHVTAATSRTITIPSTLSNGNGTAGLIKTSSTVTSNSGYTACPVINGVPYYKDTNTTYTLGSFGINATATELNYSSGLTGNIQSQLNNKSSSTHTHDNRYYTESEIDNYNLITTSEIDNICQIPTANITVNNRDCSSDISFEEARSYIENYGRLYVHVEGIDQYEDYVNQDCTIYSLDSNNTSITIDIGGVDWYILWTSSQIRMIYPPQ